MLETKWVQFPGGLRQPLLGLTGRGLRGCSGHRALLCVSLSLFPLGNGVALVGFEELSSLHKTNSFFPNVRAEFGSHCLSFPVLGFVINQDFCFVLFFFLVEEMKGSRPLDGGLNPTQPSQQSQEIQVMALGWIQTKTPTPHFWKQKLLH